MDETDDRTEPNTGSVAEQPDQSDTSDTATELPSHDYPHPKQTTDEPFSLDYAESDDASAEINEETKSNVAGSLDRLEPLEPQEINLENAAFVLLGVLLVVGFLLGALLGL